MSYPNPNLVPSSATLAQLRAGGLSNLLERLISVNGAAEPNPTVAATLSSNAGGTAGGVLPAGVYYVTFTETNGVGETTVSAESGPVTVAVQSAPSGTPTVVVSGSGGTLPAGVYYGKFTYVDSNLNGAGVHGESTAGTEFTFTQTAAATPTITINDGGLPSWASGRNLYLTTAGGGSGNEVLAFTGITGATYQITSGPSASTIAPPSTNTTSTNIPKITAFPALQTGNVARNIYLSPAGGGTGSEVLYATGVTASTFTFSYAAPANSFAVKPPAFNTTGFTYKDANGNTINFATSNIRAAERGNLQDVYNNAAITLNRWLRGDPISSQAIVSKMRHAHVAFATIAQAFADAGSLVDANPGTLRPSTSGGVGTVPTVKRSWP